MICSSVLWAERMVATRSSRGLSQLREVPVVSGYSPSSRAMIVLPVFIIAAIPDDTDSEVKRFFLLLGACPER